MYIEDHLLIPEPRHRDFSILKYFYVGVILMMVHILMLELEIEKMAAILNY
jgi:hypothetical protein